VPRGTEPRGPQDVAIRQDRQYRRCIAGIRFVPGGRAPHTGDPEGAADYIVKPFSPSELTARVRAALCRVAGPRPFALGELTVRYDQRRVTVAGQPVQLTPTEYELLRVLSLNAGRVLTHESLLRRAWRRRDQGSTDPKLVRAVVKRLRRKGLSKSARAPHRHGK